MKTQHWSVYYLVNSTLPISNRLFLLMFKKVENNQLSLNSTMGLIS